MSKLARYLIFDLQNDWCKPSIKFFRSSGAYGYIIWLTIIDRYYEKKKISMEELIFQIQKYGSRRTIIDFINKAAEAKLIIKKNSVIDKRKIFIEPSKITIQEYEEWSKEFIKNVI